MRYYFHLRDGDRRELDPTGVEFETLEEAIADARKAALEILVDEAAAVTSSDGRAFEISDAAGRVQARIPFVRKGAAER